MKYLLAITLACYACQERNRSPPAPSALIGVRKTIDQALANPLETTYGIALSAPDAYARSCEEIRERMQREVRAHSQHDLPFANRRYFHEITLGKNVTVLVGTHEGLISRVREAAGSVALPHDTGVVESYDLPGRDVIIVTGDTVQSVQKAARALSLYDTILHGKYLDFHGKRIHVTGNGFLDLQTTVVER